MRMTSACLRLTAATSADAAGARAWYPCPEQLADIVCVDESVGDIGPRILTQFGITVVPAPAVIRVESSRSVVTDRNWILLIPPSQLHAVRVGDRTPGALTLLLGASQLKGLPVPDRPALVADASLGRNVAALVAQWRRPLRPLGLVFAIRSLLERLLAHRTMLGPPIGRRATSLLPVRDYLRTHLGGPVPTAVLAAMTGLTECHLIRAFHTEFGLPPHAYHLRVRLAAASDLLGQGLAVSAAAYECGFADQSHLSRKFKLAYGLTPAAWATAAADARRQYAPTDDGSAAPRSGNPPHARGRREHSAPVRPALSAAMAAGERRRGTWNGIW
jgi:AraC-like DNA-binding protein